MSEAKAESAAPSRSRKLGLTVLASAVLLAGAAWGTYYFMVLRHFESTDNAYVQGNVVQITPQVGGTVLAIHADDTDVVKAGQPLVRLDPADAQLALDQAEAQLAQTVREVRTLYANNATLKAQIALREADVARMQSDVARARDDVARREPLVATGAVGKEEFHHSTAQLEAARSAVTAAQSALAASREQLASNQSLTDGTTVEEHPNVQRAAARVREAYLALRRADLPAPIDGMIARRSVQVGQRVQAGAPLMAIVPLHQVWVDANFKESQLQNIRIGQPVTLEADVYGTKVEYRGKVEGSGRRHGRGLLAAAGAERHRQLDQDRAARAGARLARSGATRRASLARGPLDGGACRCERPFGQDARRGHAQRAGGADAGVRRGQQGSRERRATHHRRQPRPSAQARPRDGGGAPIASAPAGARSTSRGRAEGEHRRELVRPHHPGASRARRRCTGRRSCWARWRCRWPPS